jgi:hypothetical protein
VFRTTVAELAATPFWLQRCDRAALMAFSVHTVNFRIAQRHVDLEGLVVSGKVSPWAITAQKESSLATALGCLLGLNPSSRETLHVESPKPPGPDQLTPPNRHVSLERTLSLTETETVFQQDLEAPGLFDPVVEVQPEPVVVTPPAAGSDPVVESPAAAAVAESDDVATVEPGPTVIPLEGVQLQGEPVAEAPVKKKTVNWPFPRFP